MEATATATPAPPAPATAPGTQPGAAYAGSIGAFGVSPIIWYGGSDPTVSGLAAIVQGAGATSATVFVDGAPYVLIPGAPDFANLAFNALFPTAVIPSGTIVLVTSGLTLDQAMVIAEPIAQGMSTSPVTLLSAESGRLGTLFPGNLPAQAGDAVWAFSFSGTFYGSGGPAPTAPNATSTPVPPEHFLSVVLDAATGGLVLMQIRATP